MNSKRFHIIFDLSNVNQEIANKPAIESFMRNLVEKVNMSILHGPVAVEGIPDNPGVTCFVVIDFSHISIHTFTKYNEALIDIFSCKEFDKEAAKKFCQNFFGVDDTNTRLKEVWWGD